MGQIPELDQICAVDISKTSLDLTKSIIDFFIPLRKVRYVAEDILKFNEGAKYDFVSAGEVIEHVRESERIIEKASQLLDSKGSVFISTCVNCPMIDHLRHFEFVESIQELLIGCGLRIVDERVLPVEELPMEEIVSRKITINYCAICEKG